MRTTVIPSGSKSIKLSLRIRRAEATDIAAIIALDERVTGLVKQNYWQEIFARYDQSRHKNGFFLLAESRDRSNDARLLGFIIGEVRAWEFGSAPCGWLIALSVEPEARLHGVGEALFEAISTEFKKASVGKMRTMVAGTTAFAAAAARSRQADCSQTVWNSDSSIPASLITSSLRTTIGAPPSTTAPMANSG